MNKAREKIFQVIDAPDDPELWREIVADAEESELPVFIRVKSACFMAIADILERVTDETN